jgi:CubicO group peptidase (beta-lactamase class C family)
MTDRIIQVPQRVLTCEQGIDVSIVRKGSKNSKRIILPVDISPVDEFVDQGIVEGVFPGACYSIGNARGFVTRSRGRIRYDRDAAAVDPETLWDLASLTKVVGTTAAAMVLHDEAILELDSPLASLIPEFGDERITIRNLLLHNSGLPASHPNPTSFTSPQELMRDIIGLKLAYETGTDCVYSDVGFVLLGEALSRLAGQPLEELFASRVFTPIGMEVTGFNPVQRERCAPTEPVEPWRTHESYWTTGEVHDPTAAVLGGVAGHAGLFSTIADVSKFMQSMLALHANSLFVRRASAKSSRALGWDTPSAGSSAGTRLGPHSFGHTGFTGTSLWADPDRDLFAVLLTNRVHPTASNVAIKSFRPAFHDLVVESVDRA